MAGGCNGLGACAPAASGSTCSPGTCVNSGDALGAVAHAGQWSSTALVSFQCNGGTGAAACVQKSGAACANSLTCNAGGTACKTSCTTHADCLHGFYCFQGECDPSTKDRSRRLQPTLPASSARPTSAR